MTQTTGAADTSRALDRTHQPPVPAAVQDLWADWGYTGILTADEGRQAQQARVALQGVTAIVNALAQGDQYRVALSGTATAWTDMRVKQVSVTSAALYDPRLTPDEGLAITTAMAVHEAGHGRISGPNAKAVEKAYKSTGHVQQALAGRLSNIVEDVRLEADTARLWPAYGPLFPLALWWVAQRYPTGAVSRVPASQAEAANFAVAAIRYADLTRWDDTVPGVASERAWWQAWGASAAKAKGSTAHVAAIREAMAHIAHLPEQAPPPPAPEPEAPEVEDDEQEDGGYPGDMDDLLDESDEDEQQAGGSPSEDWADEDDEQGDEPSLSGRMDDESDEDDEPRVSGDWDDEPEDGEDADEDEDDEVSATGSESDEADDTDWDRNPPASPTRAEPTDDESDDEDDESLDAESAGQGGDQGTDMEDDESERSEPSEPTSATDGTPGDLGEGIGDEDWGDEHTEGDEAEYHHRDGEVEGDSPDDDTPEDGGSMTYGDDGSDDDFTGAEDGSMGEQDGYEPERDALTDSLPAHAAEATNYDDRNRDIALGQAMMSESQAEASDRITVTHAGYRGYLSDDDEGAAHGVSRVSVGVVPLDTDRVRITTNPAVQQGLRGAFTSRRTARDSRDVARSGRVSGHRAFRVAAGFDNIFTRRDALSPDRLDVHLLVDASGSMHDRVTRARWGAPAGPRRVEMAAQMAANITEALDRLPYIRVHVWAHNTAHGTTLWDVYDSRKGQPLARIAGITASGSNNDASAIAALTHRVVSERSTRERSIIVVISDGAPCEPEDWVKGAADSARKQKVGVVSVAIAGGLTKTQEACYGVENVVPWTGDWSALATGIAKIIGKMA